MCHESVFVNAVLGPLCVRRVCSYMRYSDHCVSKECVRIRGIGTFVCQKSVFVYAVLGSLCIRRCIFESHVCCLKAVMYIQCESHVCCLKAIIEFPVFVSCF